MRENALIEKSIDLQKSDYLDDTMASSMLSDCLEIKRILISSINTAKENMNAKDAH